MVSFILLGFAVPVVLYLQIMGLYGWSSSVSASGNSIFGNADRTVYLFEAPTTTEHFNRIGGNYENLLGPWRSYLVARNKSFKIVKDAAGLNNLKSGILVLPSAVALSNAERTAIKVFRDQGGSILATWATGTRDEKGDWVGWGFLEELGASDIGPLPNAADMKYLVMVGESPVSFTHSAGQRIAMAKPSEALLKMKGPHVAGRFMNTDRIQASENRENGAVIYLEKPQNLSRSVVFAFSESAWETKPFAAHVLIEDALQWLAHDVVITKANWPMGNQSAQVFQMDIVDQISNATSFAAALRAAGYPATFFITSIAVNDGPQIVQALAKDFEIAYHGDSGVGFRGVDPVTQRRRLTEMVRDLKTSLPNQRGIIGFKAPSESADKATETALKQMDLRYHATDGTRSEARLPLFIKTTAAVDQEELLLLPRTQRDDQALLLGDASITQITQNLLDDLNESASSGSLGWLTVHSKNMEAGSVFGLAFNQYVEASKKIKKNIWYANAGQVHQWWRDRERIKVDSSFNGRRLEFNVTVLGETPVDGASFIVMLPSKDSKPIVHALKVGVAVPKVVALDEFRAMVLFDQTKPGNYNYSVSFNAK